MLPRFGVRPSGRSPLEQLAIFSRFWALALVLSLGVSCAQDEDPQPAGDISGPEDTAAAGDQSEPPAEASDASYQSSSLGRQKIFPKGVRESGSVVALEPANRLDESGRPNPLAYSPVLIFDFDVGEDLSQLIPEFTLRYSSHLPEGDTPQLVRYGMSAPPSIGVAADAVSVFDAGDWLGFFLSLGAGAECLWVRAEEAYVVVDQFGMHPMLTTDGTAWRTALTAEFANLEDKNHDWLGVPARGDAFFRQWRSQEHLVEVPFRDGLVFRYEGGTRYQPRGLRGRGNSAHHWNLLAYDLELSDDDGAPNSCFSRAAASVFNLDWLEQYGSLFDAGWTAIALAAARDGVDAKAGSGDG